MEKFKIYVHHNYSYERFWYFFHGVDVNIDDVVTHTNRENAFNKKIPIKDNVNIKCKYKENDLDITFVGERDYHLEGHHIIDYSIDLYDRNLTSDRGFNSNIRRIVDKEYIPLLNKSSRKENTKFHFFYIDWEGHNPWYEHKMNKTLSNDVNVYVDEIDDDVKSKHFCFTNTIMSFIYPNTLGLRDYIYFADILKYKNDYNHKLNYPVRRFYQSKLLLFNKIMKLDDRQINVTHSSFHDTNHYAGWRDNKYRNDLKRKIGEKNFIEKRGYGIDDWGGEWNKNNLSEFLWKMFSFGEVNILPEYNPHESIQFGDFSKHNPKMIGFSYITEKTISHIFANKPFIPTSYHTVDFYQNILRENGYEVIPFPLVYSDLARDKDSIKKLNDIAKDDDTWNEFLGKLKLWVTHLRTSILEMVNTKNNFLDVLLDTELTKPKENLL